MVDSLKETQMNLTRLRSAMMLLGLYAAFGAHTAVADPYVVTEVMSGLVTPRGLAFGPDGGLYVAEAGSGGADPASCSVTARPPSSATRAG